MFRQLFWASMACILSLPAAASSGDTRLRAPYHRPSDQRLVDREYIVMLKADHPLEQHFEAVGTDVAADAPFFRQIHTLPGYRAELDDDMLDAIRLDPGVRSVHHDTYVDRDGDLESEDSFNPDADELENENSDDGDELTRRWTKSRQKDPPFNLAQISAFSALTIPEKSRSPYDYVSDSGEGVLAFVMDTGVNIEHSDFGGRASHFQGRKHTKYCRRKPQSMDDFAGHGTHIAGIIGGATHGVARSVRLINVPVICKDGTSTMGALTEALSDVTREHNNYKKSSWFRGSVINMSLGKYEKKDHNSPLYLGLKAAFDAGMYLVASAGNNDREAGDRIPCAYGSVVNCVAAVDEEYFKLDESNYGPAVRISAPGHQISSADYKRPTKFTPKSGTSQAAAHVSGVLAGFISWEALVSDPHTGRQRMEENKQYQVIELFPKHPPTRDGFVTNGIRLSMDGAPYCKSLRLLAFTACPPSFPVNWIHSMQ